MSEQKIPIPAMLYNAAVGGHVTNSQQIIDEDYNIEQKDVNKEVLGVPYNATTPNGMGRIVLKKNDNFKQVVEAQTNGNTIFVIKYDFTLTGNVTVPANCVLEFDGGSLSGSYTMTGNNTELSNAYNSCMHINISGTFKGKCANINWFNLTGDDISSTLQVLVNSYDTIIINDGIYYITDTVILRSGVSIIGEDRKNSIIKASVDKYKTAQFRYTMLSTVEIEDGWNTGYGRRGNMDNVSNEILYTNIHISNLTFDLNRHPEDFTSPNSNYIVCIYLCDTTNSYIDNCSFIDYQQDGVSGDHLNCGWHVIQLYNATFCRVSNCYSEKTTFLYSGYGEYNEACFNKGYYTIGTWIESGTSPYFWIHDNELQEEYWESSMMSTNSKYCVIERNKIISTLDKSYSSGFTFGHSGSTNDANHGVFKNNYINLYKSQNGVLVQNADYITIDSNDITVQHHPLEEGKEEESWSNWRYIDKGAVEIEVNTDNSIITIVNNIIIDGQYQGISIKTSYSGAINIENNNIYGYTNGIYINGGSKSVCNINKNNIDGKYTAINILGNNKQLIINYNCLKNIISCISENFKFMNNTVDLENHRNYAAQHGVVGFIFYITAIGNVFKNIDAYLDDSDQPLDAIFYSYSATYDSSIDIQKIYNTVKGNNYPNTFNSKVTNIRFNDSGFKSIYTNHIIHRGIGDRASITLTPYEEGTELYDKVLKKKVIWNGTAWVDAIGTPV